MKYQVSDPIWQSFGIDSFEGYCEKIIVTAKFHSHVPNDIIEDFASAEYMMAYAYYHYPLYHEAFSKVLRIIELAVKTRCSQLNIPVEWHNPKRNRNEKKVLKTLMDELQVVEQEKELATRFEIARSLRNSLMHPTQYSHSGALSRDYIKQAIILLNTLFLPGSLFTLFRNECKRIQLLLTPFSEKPIVLEHSNKRYLITHVSCEAAYRTDEKWNYLIIGYPIMLNATELLSQHSYLKLFSFVAKEINIVGNDLEIICSSRDEKIHINLTINPKNISVFEEYKTGLSSVTETDRKMYEHYTAHQVGEIENSFWYENLWKIKLEQL
jgi:hypothetical protein